MDQTTHMKKIIKKCGIEDYKSTPTPYDPSNKLSPDMTQNKEKEIPYQEAVGCLLYIIYQSENQVCHSVCGKLSKSLYAKPKQKPLDSYEAHT